MFRLGQVRGANVAMVLMSAAMVGMFFILACYQQQVQGYSAIKPGSPRSRSASCSSAWPAAPAHSSSASGSSPPWPPGSRCSAGGIAWFAQITAQGSYLADVLCPSLIIGAGLAFAFVALTVASSNGVDEANHGTAGGLINMTQQIGGTIGLAVASAVAAVVVPPARRARRDRSRA
jgi:hypothetical protein